MLLLALSKEEHLNAAIQLVVDSFEKNQSLTINGQVILIRCKGIASDTPARNKIQRFGSSSGYLQRLETLIFLVTGAVLIASLQVCIARDMFIIPHQFLSKREGPKIWRDIQK